MKVSFHIGNAGKQMSRSHNNRENAPEHADKERQGSNMVLVDKDLTEYLTDALRDAVRAFNEKNIKKHPDRVKSLDSVVKDGKEKAREIIIQVGDKDSQMSDSDYRELYLNIIKDFETNNPNFKVFGAYVHFDETTPHIHLDFIPIAETTRGLTRNVSLEGALKNMGYKDTGKYEETAFRQWLDHTRTHLEEYARSFCEAKGYDLEEHTPRTRGNIAKHREKWQSEIDELRSVAKSLKVDIEELNGIFDGLISALKNARDEAERSAILSDIQTTIQTFTKDDVTIGEQGIEKGQSGVEIKW